MKKLGNWFAASWSELLFFALGSIGIIFLLWFGLGDMLPGLSRNEMSQAAASGSFEELVNNPLGLPHKTLQYATQQIQHSAFGVRSASALIGLVTIGCFYYILRNWYSKRVALLGTLIFATSAWFLHVARFGTDSSMYFLLFASVASALWLQRSRGSFMSILAGAFIVITLLYIPGMIWFVIPAVLWQIGRIGEILEGQNAGMLTLLGLLVLALLSPIGWAMYQHPELVKTYFGLPQVFPEPVEIAKNILYIPMHLFVRGPDNPEIWLGRLPLINLFTGVMFAVGLYAYFFKRRLDRTWFIFFVFVAGGVLASIGGPVDIAIIMPFVYLVAAGGIALMLQQWFTVFPRNPFARSTGTILMTAVVLLAAFNGFSHYFIAWPNTPATKEVYTERIR